MKFLISALAIASISVSAALAGPIAVASGGEGVDRKSIAATVVDQVKFSLVKFVPTAGETKAKPKSKPVDECKYTGHPGHESTNEEEVAHEEEKASGPEPMYFGF